ncbi:MAG: phage terminase large subunit [Alphaproteobacteria bacterium]
MKINFKTYGNEKQKLCGKYWIDNDIEDIVYGGSKGSAKSFTGCSLIFGDALIYPETHYFIARKKLTDLRKFTIPSIYEVFKFWGLDPKTYMKYNGMDNYFHLHNDSKVFLIDAKYLPSDPTYSRFGSMQMTRGWIEEAGEFERASMENLKISIGRWKNEEYGINGKMLQTCNPAKNYLYKDYYKKNKTGTLEEYKRFIQALPTDNKRLVDSYLEMLNRTLSKKEKERLLFGNWEYDDDPSVLIEYDNILNMFTNNFVEGGNMYITADIARFGRDKTVIGVWDGFRLIKIVTIDKNKITEAATAIDTLATTYKVPRSNIVIDEDGVGGGVVDMLPGAKGFVNNSSPIDDPSKDKKIKENYANLKSQCYFKFADRVNNNGYYIETESQTERDLIIEECEVIKQKNMEKDGKKAVLGKDDVKALLGRSCDYSDMMMEREYFELNSFVFSVA